MECVSSHFYCAPGFCWQSADAGVFSPPDKRLCPGDGTRSSAGTQTLSSRRRLYCYWCLAVRGANPTDLRVTAQQHARRLELRFLRVFLSATALRRNFFCALRSGWRRWSSLSCVLHLGALLH